MNPDKQHTQIATTSSRTNPAIYDSTGTAQAHQVSTSREETGTDQATDQKTSSIEETEPVATKERSSSTAVGSKRRLLRRIARWLLVACVVYGIAWTLWVTRSALLPFGIGIALAYLLMPLVNTLNRFMPRWSAILLVYIASLVVLTSLAAYIIPLVVYQATQLIQSIPTFSVEDMRSQANELFGEYKRLVPPEVRSPVEEGVSSAYMRLKENLVNYAQGFGAFLFNRVLQFINTLIFLISLVVIPVWMFYVMNDYQSGRETVNRLLPKRIRNDFWSIVEIVDRLLSSYIRGQIFLSLVVGTAAWVGLFILGLFGFKVQYILLLAFIAGLMEFVPIIGPVLGAIPAVLLGLLHSPTTALAVAILYLVIQVLENNFLVPRILGDSVGIHPSILIVSMVVSGHMFGIIGVILVAPTLAIARDVFLYAYNRLGHTPVATHSTPDPPTDTS